jgi:hypothetical protein
MVIQTKSAKFEVDINREFSTSYFDFLEACMDPESGLERLAKVIPRPPRPHTVSLVMVGA